MTAAGSKIRNRGERSEHPQTAHKGSVHPAPSSAMMMLTLTVCSELPTALSALVAARGEQTGPDLSEGAALE